MRESCSVPEMGQFSRSYCYVMKIIMARYLKALESNQLWKTFAVELLCEFIRHKSQEDQAVAFVISNNNKKKN